MAADDHHQKKAIDDMTLLSELIDIPTEVHKSDFVISLRSAIEDPERTMADYVVTPQLADCFDQVLSLVTSSVESQTSKASYLHASFGGGKSAFMAVTHLLLRGEPAARSQTELAPILTRYQTRLEGRQFLLVPYQAVGANSLEQVVLGGYVDYVARLHPEAPLPAVYQADGIVNDAVIKRGELGDEAFFALMNTQDQADEWGDYGSGWDAARFEAATAALPNSTERDELLSALLKSHYRALPGQAQAAAEGFVPIDAGLEAISRHAKSLGYDAVVLFLDELVLWLASRSSEREFVSREGAKFVKLVEGDDQQRPAPIVSVVARQRDLRELVGDHVLGVDASDTSDVLRHSEGRFDTIRLEDRNLQAIAEKRLLAPKSEAARHQLDDAFEAVRREIEGRGERDVLLTETGDLESFRRLYPFSPALVDALISLSGAMQRERTALKIMLQLLVDNRDRLKVGELIPLGDLFDAISGGDEPLTEVMRAQFAQARRLWSSRLQPWLLTTYQVDVDSIDELDTTHPYVSNSRLVKSLLVAALVPEVGSLRTMTVSRLTALNSGVVRGFVPGSERQQVLELLRRIAGDIGELRISDDDQDPVVSIQLEGVDTSAIIAAASTVETEGARRGRIIATLADLLQIQGIDTQMPTIEMIWRGTPRTIDVLFANVRDPERTPDQSLRAEGRPKLVIDLPMDDDDFGPNDDRARIDMFRTNNPPEWTALWLPNFLTTSAMKLVGKSVVLDHLLSGDTLDRYTTHLPPGDRQQARATLTNERATAQERIRSLLRQAYGVEPAHSTDVDQQLRREEHFASLDPAMDIRPPAAVGLREYAEHLADQLLTYRYPKHPVFPDRISTGDLRTTLAQFQMAVRQRDGRLEAVEQPVRRVLSRVAGPLKIGSTHDAHFIAEMTEWIDIINQRQAETGTSPLTVRALREWIDGDDVSGQRRGLTTEVSDLVILAYAAATDHVVMDGTRPVPNLDIGRLQPEWQLIAEDPPAEDVWERAVARARDMGIVPSSLLRSGAAAADLNARIVNDLIADRADAVRTLVGALASLGQNLAVADDGPRLRTARAAAQLCDDIARAPEDAVEALAALDIPSSAAAIGTSIKQAPSLCDGIARANTALLKSAIEFRGEHQADAQRIGQRLREAVVEDELTIGLLNRLAEAENAATDLLARIAAQADRSENEAGTETGAVGDAPGSTGSEPGDDPAPQVPVGSETEQSDAAQLRTEAEAQLEAMRARLAAQANLRLSWSISEGSDGDD